MNNFILILILAILIYPIFIKVALKFNKKIEAEKNKREYILSKMTKKERKEYSKFESSTELACDFIYSVLSQIF